jgi:cell division protein FtsB
MVVRYRWRRFFGILLLWGASALVTGYFVAQAYEGARGIEAKRQIKSRILALRNELAELKDKRVALERKVAMLHGPVLDADLLDERARAELGRINRNDLVIFIKDGGGAKEGGASRTP